MVTGSSLLMEARTKAGHEIVTCFGAAVRSSRSSENPLSEKRFENVLGCSPHIRYTLDLLLIGTVLVILSRVHDGKEKRKQVLQFCHGMLTACSKLLQLVVSCS